ncbi:MAG: hypothetical protein IPJ30_04730 [Acidobacteria bacterium]|nr:hypothetical protein [Acidobacteriota bacterium]
MRVLFGMCLVIASFAFVSSGQSDVAFEAPEECYSLLLISNPSSPAQLTNGKSLVPQDGGISSIYTLNNLSERGLVQVVVMDFEWFGDNETTSPITVRPGAEIYPGEAIPSDDLTAVKIRPFSDMPDGDSKTNLCRFPNFKVFMVTKVVFADGEIWSDETNYEKLRIWRDTPTRRHSPASIIDIKSKVAAKMTELMDQKK